jgi:hypothetical protein
MPTSNLYFGPYNDPGGSTGKKHWEAAHDVDCQNPAFIVRKNLTTYTIKIAVRNINTSASPTDVSVSVYGIKVPSSMSLSKIDTWAGQLAAGTLASQVPGGTQTTFSIAPNNIPQYSSSTDFPWVAGPISWGPSGAKGIILVAKLTCPTWGLLPTPGLAATVDPCIAVWVGT